MARRRDSSSPSQGTPGDPPGSEPRHRLTDEQFLATQLLLRYYLSMKSWKQADLADDAGLPVYVKLKHGTKDRSKGVGNFFNGTLNDVLYDYLIAQIDKRQGPFNPNKMPSYLPPLIAAAKGEQWPKPGDAAPRIHLPMLAAPDANSIDIAELRQSALSALGKGEITVFGADGLSSAADALINAVSDPNATVLAVINLQAPTADQKTGLNAAKVQVAYPTSGAGKPRRRLRVAHEQAENFDQLCAWITDQLHCKLIWSHHDNSIGLVLLERTP